MKLMLPAKSGCCDIICLMPDIETFREKLQTLVAKFEKDKPHYLSKGYPEAHRGSKFATCSIYLMMNIAALGRRR